MSQWSGKLFSESGEASFCRVGAFIALVFACAWISYLVLKNHALPDLEGITFFISTIYALGKGNETLQKILGRGKQ